MKHDLKISIRREPLTDGIVRCRTVTLRERLMARLFGKESRLTVIVPGDSVETLSINEIKEGGLEHEQNQTAAGRGL